MVANHILQQTWMVLRRVDTPADGFNLKILGCTILFIFFTCKHWTKISAWNQLKSILGEVIDAEL